MDVHEYSLEDLAFKLLGNAARCQSWVVTLLCNFAEILHVSTCVVLAQFFSFCTRAILWFLCVVSLLCFLLQVFVSACRLL